MGEESEPGEPRESEGEETNLVSPLLSATEE